MVPDLVQLREECMSRDMHEANPPLGAGMGALNARARRLVSMGAMPWFGLSIDGGCVAWWCIDQRSNAWHYMA